MYQAFLDGSTKTRSTLNNFGGLNCNEYCAPNEMTDMENLSSDAFPFLTQRARRKFISTPTREMHDPVALKFLFEQGGNTHAVVSQKISTEAGMIYECRLKLGGRVVSTVRCEAIFYKGETENSSLNLYDFDSYRFAVPADCDGFRIRAVSMESWIGTEMGSLRADEIFDTAETRLVDFRAAVVHNGLLAVVFADKLWYDGVWVIEHISDYAEHYTGACCLLSYGAELVILPQGVAYNTITGTVRSLSATTTIYYDRDASDCIKSEKIIYSVCDANGETITAAASETAPENPADGQYWIDTSGETHQLNKWSATNKMWVGIAATYVKLTVLNKPFFSSAASAEHIQNELEKACAVFKDFKAGDGVKMQAAALYDLFPKDTYSIIRKVGIDYTEATVNGASLQIPNPYLIFTGILDQTVETSLTEQDDYLQVLRDIPAMDFYTVSRNRIWGCVARDDLNEIRCCKLGDPTNWNVYAGVTADSYSVSIGEPGIFTGAVTFEGEPYFFKENAVMKIYGSYPASYQLYTFSCEGIQPGSAGSVITSGGYLFYKASHDFYIFSGSRPQSISYKLGFDCYKKVNGGVCGNKLYFSCVTEDDEPVLLVYDRETEAWYKEKDDRYLGFCQDYAGHMYGVTEHKIVTFEKKAAQNGEGLSWFAEFGVLGLELSDQKAVGRYTIRVHMEIGASMSVLASYDDGEFEHLYTCVGEGRIVSHTFALKPVRCDHLTLRLEGNGRCTIYTISYSMEQRSDIA